jgi:hypothetical protein
LSRTSARRVRYLCIRPSFHLLPKINIQPFSIPTCIQHAVSLPNLDELSDAEVAAYMDDIDGTELLQQFETSKKEAVKVKGLVKRDLSELSDAEVAAFMDEMGDLAAFEASKKAGKRARVKKWVKSVVSRQELEPAYTPPTSGADLSELSDAEVAAFMDEMGDLAAFEASKKAGKRARVKKWVRSAVDSAASLIANEATATAPAGSRVDVADLSDAEITAMIDDLDEEALSAIEQAKRPLTSGEAAAKAAEAQQKQEEEPANVMEGGCI